MTQQRIIDSHIHLWDAAAANRDSHQWMQPGAHLTRQYSIQDYLSASSPSSPTKYDIKGFVYVETDRTVDHDEHNDVVKWAREPLLEMAFLRRIVIGESRPGDGFDPSTSYLLKGIVAWAPLNRGVAAFQAYIEAAKDVAGEQTWELVKGFRFLLQGTREEEVFRELVEGEEFVRILRIFGQRGWSFDVGVDQRQGGIWQLEMAAKVIDRVHDGVENTQKTIFIANHLCKPDMEQDSTDKAKEGDFENWKAAILSLASHEKVYMKLSGGFSEIADQDPSNPWPVAKIVERMWPWLDHIFACFTPQRIMFGSDWPVCNVRGPGDVLAWGHWRNVIEYVLEERKLSASERNRIWFGTAAEAYRLGDD